MKGGDELFLRVVLWVCLAALVSMIGLGLYLTGTLGK